MGTQPWGRTGAGKLRSSPTGGVASLVVHEGNVVLGIGGIPPGVSPLVGGECGSTSTFVVWYIKLRELAFSLLPVGCAVLHYPPYRGPGGGNLA